MPLLFAQVRRVLLCWAERRRSGSQSGDAGSSDVVLVDTSVWVDHLRRGNAKLAGLLNKGKVVCHACVVRELACGRPH